MLAALGMGVVGKGPFCTFVSTLAFARTTNSNSAWTAFAEAVDDLGGRGHLHRRAIGYVDLERRRGVEGTIAQ